MGKTAATGCLLGLNIEKPSLDVRVQGTFYIRIIPYPYFGTILTYFVPQEILGHMKDLCVQHQMLKSEVARLDQVERLAADADVKHQRQAEADPKRGGFCLRRRESLELLQV